MGLRNKLLAALTGLLVGLSGTVMAALPTLNLTIFNASGPPGSIVSPTVAFDIDGFSFDSFTLDLSFDPTVLSFLPDASTLTYQNQTIAFTALPGFNIPSGFTDVGGDGQWHQRYAFSTLNPVTVSGSLVLAGAFKIAAAAPAGPYPITVTGSASTGPGFEEPSFSGIATISAVPEPETWLLLLGGLGLIGLRRSRSTR